MRDPMPAGVKPKPKEPRPGNPRQHRPLHLFHEDSTWVDIDYRTGETLYEGHSPACWCNPIAVAADSIVFDGSMRWAPLPEEY